MTCEHNKYRSSGGGGGGDNCYYHYYYCFTSLVFKTGKITKQIADKSASNNKTTVSHRISQNRFLYTSRFSHTLLNFTDPPKTFVTYLFVKNSASYNLSTHTCLCFQVRLPEEQFIKISRSRKQYGGMCLRLPLLFFSYSSVYNNLRSLIRGTRIFNQPCSQLCLLL